tara:strand:- start:1043 stop:1375 length:333 start_codon:yes stop_codon:yes gene_type:complete
MEFTEQQIKTIIEDHKNRLMKDRLKYEQIKDTEDFKIKNRQRSKEYYKNNKDKKALLYLENKEFLKARNSYYYYSKRDKMDIFIDKFPDRYELMKKKGYFKDESDINILF